MVSTPKTPTVARTTAKKTPPPAKAGAVDVEEEAKPRVSGQGLMERQKSSALHGTLVRGASFMCEDPDNGEAFKEAQKKKLADAKKKIKAAVGGTEGSKLSDQLAAVEALSRQPTMVKDPKRLIPSPTPENRDKKYTIVLDLDETVVYARDGPLFARAHLKEMLRTMDEVGEVIVWTAGDREYAKAVLKEINIEEIIQHLVYRDKTWFNAADYTKDLRQLGRDMDYVIIIENTPDCLRLNPQNGIIVDDYEGGSARDSTLLNLIRLIKDLGASGQKVPEFLAACKLLQRQTVDTGDQKIPIFFLPSRKIPERKSKTNDEPGTPKTATASTSGKVATPKSPIQTKVVKQNRDRQYASDAKLPPTTTPAATKPPTPSKVGAKRGKSEAEAVGGEEEEESPKKKRRVDEKEKK